MKSQWFDGHLDLACLALEGRDLMEPAHKAHGGPRPVSVTFPSLEKGGVVRANATIFTAPDMEASFGYPSNDPEAAHALGVRQLKFYKMWEQIGLLQIIRNSQDFDFLPANPLQKRPLQVVLLMEGADPIRTPEEVEWWYDQGLRIIGLSWNKGTRYAGGNGTTHPLTSLGKNCVQAIEKKGIIHDLSHLSDASAWELLDMTQGPVIASHSNARALMHGKNQRHLSDELIREINNRNGVIGINLFSRFLTKNFPNRRATIEETIQHIEHICEIMKRSDGIALGSDMDGGFGANFLPEGIDHPSDLGRLLQALMDRGWSRKELLGFAQCNWLTFMRKNLPSEHQVEEREELAPQPISIKRA